MSIGELLAKRREDLAAIDNPYQQWDDINRWYAGLKLILVDHFPKHVASFDQLIDQKWPFPVIKLRNGISVSAGDPHGQLKKANEKAAKDAQRQILITLSALIDLQSLNECSQESSGRRHAAISNRVFLVHGHDDHAVHETARFLEKLELNAVILREQPNGGRTIIEKFEDYADVSFAVVLLTGDDRGGTKDQTQKQQRLRARQNVILELGFFLGRLNRANVCALHEADVDIPSDYDGVVFVPYDSHGGWKLKLLQELKAAKLPIDMSKVV